MDRRQFLALSGALGIGAMISGCAGAASTWPSASSTARSVGPFTQLADAVVPTPAEDATALASPLGAFASDLTLRLAPTTQNLVWSPWSVAMVLAMVRDGAAGATASEITKVLHADADVDARLADGWARMAHAPGEPLHAANAVWAQAGETWQQPFLDKLTALAASLKLWDFRADPTGAVKAVNGWISDHTAGKITDLLPADAVDTLTRLILVNALHFKASWLHALNEVGSLPFAAPSGVATVPCLRTVDALPGARGSGWTRAALPCAVEGGSERNEFVLVVVLPDDPATNPASLHADAFLGDASGALVTLTMPAWKLSQLVTMNSILKVAGMPLAFEPGSADFSAMTADERLYVSLVAHQAFIDVNAKGIEATAATVAVMEVASAPVGEPITLTLDRPFAYALVHQPTATPLFMGVVADPTKTSV
jgi:serine protease inhibitor